MFRRIAHRQQFQIVVGVECDGIVRALARVRTVHVETHFAVLRDALPQVGDADQFRYVCTWSTPDNGTPICIFAFDIYRLSRFAVEIRDFPRAVIGFYSAGSTPNLATKCSRIRIENTDDEVLYPILES